MSQASTVQILALCQGWILRTPDDAAVIRRSRPLVDRAEHVVGNTWGVPSSQGGAYVVTVAGWHGTCECYHYVNAGRCKHFWAARIAAQLIEIRKEETMSDAIVVSNVGSRDLEPRSVEEALRVAAIVAKTGLCGVRTPEEAFIRIATGKELGLTAMQSLRGIHVINGRAVLDAALIVGLVKVHPACEYFKLSESTDKIATYTTSRKNEGVTTMSFTIEQAKAAGLLEKATWKHYPEAMLRARASAALARAVYPDQLNGLYIKEELEAAPKPGAPLVVAPAIEAVVEHEATVEHTPTTLYQAVSECVSLEALAALGMEFRRLNDAKKFTSKEEYESLKTLLIDTRDMLQKEAANAA